VNAPLTIHTVAIREDGCFSALLWEGRPFAVSVERTFDAGEAEHGKRLVLPAGLIRCTADFYHKGGYATYQLHIDGHTRVLFHKGNREEHSLACVVVGESFGGYSPQTKSYSNHAMKDDQTAVLASGSAFEEFMILTAGRPEFYAQVLGR
jgi:hypothetical protein